MDNYQKCIELFKTGSSFEQIRFLDEFYSSNAVGEFSTSDLSNILFTGAESAVNMYVKRSCLKIICNLTLGGIFTNKFKTVGLLHDFIKNEDAELITIGLKYLQYFPEMLTAETEELLKTFSDHANGEISSQSYVCLGLGVMSENISGNDISQLIENTEKAKRYFTAAFVSVENRDDADYYIMLLEWISAVLSNDSKESDNMLEALQDSLMLRSLYDRDGLELDFLLFNMISKIKSSYDILQASGEWIDFMANVRTLMAFNSEIEILSSLQGSGKGLLKSIDNNIFGNLENHLYKVHLQGEKRRLNVLKSIDQPDLTKFIEKILSFFPDTNEPNPENYDLLISLQQSFGDEGIAAYQKIRNKDIGLEKAVSGLLAKNYKNELSFKTGSIEGNQVFLDLTFQIDTLLPDYKNEKRTAFLNILEEVIRYTRLTLSGNDKSRFSFLYSKSENNGKGQDAVEQDLQDSMLFFLEHSKIADGLDHEKSKFVDGGRVDILYKKDVITVPIELKRSLLRQDEKVLEDNYLAQAQTYTSGYDQLGIFVLLELSPKEKEAPPNFKDWFKIHHLKPSTDMTLNYPDFVISVVIPGNRTGPSSKSTYK
ncbi:hypothetical protein SAMN05192550_3113 [Flavobacterium glycines]|uniref:Uncharacterized protein n=1 Tax=Flavobacterium glycines TaxID=551990 RepID=A0A1B9DT92_9FLAO|nr:hypothetical protein [Flavobacterium glycines]OCB72881.1 hypothetical protein FBGL_04480 [Flavobacterium glycines]GEL12133.1 hypothetical protein FGL01_28720 [Flavobacterium glycines]SDJ97402.1 hypothetical protein SAMN05192550_3113 [Flavobacterium glycines]